MMTIDKRNYSLAVQEEEITVFRNGERYFDLPIRSAVPADGKQDVDEEWLALEQQGMDLVFSTKSSLWDKKEYRLRCGETTFTYHVKVYGKGKPDGVRYFSGRRSNPKDGVRYETSGYFWPVSIIRHEHHEYTMAEPNDITSIYFVPPLFVYPFCLDEGQDWFGLGLIGNKGDYTFDHFQYIPGQNRFCLATDFYGNHWVDGEWELPGILGCPGNTEWEVLKSYSDWHYSDGGCKPRVRNHEPRWWYGPFFCGWGEQMAMGGNVYDRANQEDYTRMSRQLDELGLKPTAIIIDDKWQKQYGTALPDLDKWPNLREFAEQEHQKGRKVVLWFKCWSAEGLDSDECLSVWSQPVAADPTSPKYQERLKRTIYKLLSSEDGCYNCDGFKIDFANCLPVGVPVQAHEPGVYGVEMIRRLFQIIFDETKKVKPDALINCSCAHPYFAEVVDQARLHDYNMTQRCIQRTMTFRKRIYETVMPGVILDTDSAGYGSRRAAMSYMRLAPTLGVPDLYRLSSTQEAALTQKDWEEIRAIWEAYSARVDQRYREK